MASLKRNFIFIYFCIGILRKRLLINALVVRSIPTGGMNYFSFSPSLATIEKIERNALILSTILLYAEDV